MKNCKTCAWWKKGECHRVSHWRPEPGDPEFELVVTADDDSNLSSALRTGPDFGCVLHKEVK